MRKCFAFALAFGLGVLSLTGCGNGAERVELTSETNEENKVNEENEANEAGPLHIVSRNIGSATSSDNIIFEELEKNTGLELEWELKAGENYAQQCQLIIASGEYPDLMEFWSSNYPNDLQQLADDGLLMPLDDLLAEYGPNIMSCREEGDYFRSATDGKIYGLPSRIMECGNNNVIIIRKDWLDALELSIPTCYEELKNVLQAFYDNSELLTGQSNMKVVHGSAMSGGWTNMRDGMISTLASENGFVIDWNLVDGELVYYVNMPGYRETLRCVRELCQLGLIDSEYALMNREQMIDKWLTNCYGTIDWYTSQLDPATGALIAPVYEAIPEAEFVAIMPFADETGQSRVRTVGIQQKLVIFKDAGEQNAINAIKLADYMMSEEGQLLTEFGIEGVDWEYNEDGTVNAFALEASRKTELGFGTYQWFAKRYQFTPATPLWIQEYVDKMGEMAVPNYINLATETGAEKGVTLLDLINQSEAELITTPNIDFDAKFDEYVQKWNEYGGAQWTAEINEAYKSSK